MLSEQAHSPAPLSPTPAKRPAVKCVVWDLDNTLWDGTLLEDGQVTLRPGVVELIKVLDSRGILHSIASKNDQATALQKLKQLGLNEYFLYPQINWNSKASSIKAIAASLNLGADTFAFIDDQAFEREEVAYALPEVLCIDSQDLSTVLNMPEMNPRFITEDSKLRRLMYLNDIQRNQAESAFVGTSEEFLATLDMAFTMAKAQEEDLKRAEELTVRTHQLNTTGYTYSYEELSAFCHSDNHTLLVASLEDKFGAYGKIGLALIEHQPDTWILKLLLMSCRVMSRGLGTIMINHIMRLAKQAQVRFLAEFIPNERNRVMYVTYKFGGFKEVEQIGSLVLLENDLSHIQPFPDYVKVQIKA